MTDAQGEVRRDALVALAARLDAIAYNGLLFTKDTYDVERYEAVREAAADLVRSVSSSTLPSTVDVWFGDVGYRTPKVDVRGVVLRDDTILLVRERTDGLWTLPGGWAEVSESPREAVTREVREETGWVVETKRVLAIYDRSKHGHTPIYAYHVYKLFFECHTIERTGERARDILDVGFFTVADLPPLSPSRITPEQIARMIELGKRECCEPDFD